MGDAGVVWWGVVVFCWWVLFMTSQVSTALFQISAGSEDAAASGTGISTAGSAGAGATGAVVGEGGLGHCFGK